MRNKNYEKQLKQALSDIEKLKEQVKRLSTAEHQPVKDEIKVGDLCKFWDEEEKEFSIGIVKAISKDELDAYPYMCWNGGMFVNAKKITQQEAIDFLFPKE